MLPEYQLQGELVISVPRHRPSAQELGSVQAERELVSFAYKHSTHTPIVRTNLNAQISFGTSFGFQNLPTITEY